MPTALRAAPCDPKVASGLVTLALTDLATLGVSSIRAADEIEMIVREIRHELDRFLLTGQRGQLTSALDEQRDVEAWLERAAFLSVSKPKAAPVAEIHGGLDELSAQLRHVVDAPRQAVATDSVQGLVDDILMAQVLAAAHQ